jgi:NTE family protein
LRHIFIIVFSFLIPVHANSQKVALVLSGGGAKGLAHIGVLKYIEEQGIPIDCITGTSMGAVVGSFYAAGYSPEEIEAIVLSRNFRNWINGVSEGNYNSHYFSDTPDAEMISLGMGVDHSLMPKFNPSFGKDAIINFILARYLAEASAKSGNNFDSLFVPFRALAAEIFTQSQVVMDSGNLHEAVRASMAVPYIYRPVRLNDKLLFDGGLYNNFPVDVALNTFNPDVVIGVNVSRTVFEEYPYDQDEDLISKSLFINLLNKSDPATLREQDIYISPDIEGLSSTDFHKARQFIDSGYVAAERKFVGLAPGISKRRSKETVDAFRKEFNSDKAPMIFKSLQFRGFSPNQMIFMRHIFRIHKKSVHTIDEVQQGYFKLISNEFFSQIYPRISYNKVDTSFVMELINQYDRSLKIDVGGFLTSRNIGELYLGVRFNSFSRTVNENRIQIYTGRFYQSYSLSSRINFPTGNFFFIKPEILYNNWDFIEISDLLKTDEPENKFAQQDDFKGGLNVGFPVGSKYKIEARGFYINNTDKYSNISDLNSTDILDRSNFEGFKTGISISRNSLNRKQYPDRGAGLDFCINYFNGYENYLPGTTSARPETTDKFHQWLRLRLSIDHYFTVSSAFSGGWTLNTIVSNQPFFTNYTGTMLSLPVYYPLSDSRMLVLDEFRAMNFAAGGLRAIYRATDNLNFRAEGYLFKELNRVVEDEFQKPRLLDPDGRLKYAASLTGVYQSPVGPVSLGLNYYSTPNIGLGIFFHLGYLIFNERSLD